MTETTDKEELRRVCSAAPDAAQQINEAVKDIMDHFLTVEIDELPSSSQIRSILRKRLLTSPEDLARVAPDATRIPKTTYKNKRQLSNDERFKLNRALNEYTFNNCDHEHDGYPNHLTCRWCALGIIAAIISSPDDLARVRRETWEKAIQIVKETWATTSVGRVKIEHQSEYERLRVVAALEAAALRESEEGEKDA